MIHQYHVRVNEDVVRKLRAHTSAPTAAIMRAGLSQLALLVDHGQADLVRRMVIDEVIPATSQVGLRRPSEAR